MPLILNRAFGKQQRYDHILGHVPKYLRFPTCTASNITLITSNFNSLVIGLSFWRSCVLINKSLLDAIPRNMNKLVVMLHPFFHHTIVIHITMTYSRLRTYA